MGLYREEIDDQDQPFLVVTRDDRRYSLGSHTPTRTPEPSIKRGGSVDREVKNITEPEKKNSKTPWTKVKSIIQTRRDSVKKKNREGENPDDETDETLESIEPYDDVDIVDVGYSRPSSRMSQSAEVVDHQEATNKSKRPALLITVPPTRPPRNKQLTPVDDPPNSSPFLSHLVKSPKEKSAASEQSSNQNVQTPSSEEATYQNVPAAVPEQATFQNLSPKTHHQKFVSFLQSINQP